MAELSDENATYTRNTFTRYPKETDMTRIVLPTEAEIRAAIVELERRKAANLAAADKVFLARLTTQFVSRVADASHYGHITVVTIAALGAERAAELSRALVQAGANTSNLAFVDWRSLDVSEIGPSAEACWDPRALDAYEEREMKRVYAVTNALRSPWLDAETHADGCTPTETDCTCDGA